MYASCILQLFMHGNGLEGRACLEECMQALWPAVNLAHIAAVTATPAQRKCTDDMAAAPGETARPASRSAGAVARAAGRALVQAAGDAALSRAMPASRPKAAPARCAFHPALPDGRRPAIHRRPAAHQRPAACVAASQRVPMHPALQRRLQVPLLLLLLLAAAEVAVAADPLLLLLLHLPLLVPLVARLHCVWAAGLQAVPAAPCRASRHQFRPHPGSRAQTGYYCWRWRWR